MKGIVRNILFWGYDTEKMFLSVMGISVACAAMGAIMGGDVGFEGMISMLPQYIVFMGQLLIFMNAMNSVFSSFSISISFGSTRKASYIAMQIVQHLLVIQCAVLCIAIFTFTSPRVLEQIRENSVVLILAVAVLMIQANVITVVSLKGGRKWASLICLVCCLAFGGGVFILLLNKGSGEGLVELVHKINHPIFLLLGLGANAFFIWLGYRIMQKGDIKLS